MQTKPNDRIHAATLVAGVSLKAPGELEIPFGKLKAAIPQLEERAAVLVALGCCGHEEAPQQFRLWATDSAGVLPPFELDNARTNEEKAPNLFCPWPFARPSLRFEFAAPGEITTVALGIITFERCRVPEWRALPEETRDHVASDIDGKLWTIADRLGGALDNQPGVIFAAGWSQEWRRTWFS